MATLTATLGLSPSFASGDTVTPDKLNLLGTPTVALTAGTIVDADVSAGAAIALSKLATGALPAAITVASANLVDGTIATADVADAAITAAKLNGAQTGSAPIYGCRAWVRFDGTKDTTGAASTANTNRQILASANVASVLRNSAGDYTVTFTTAMPASDYAAIVSSTHATGLSYATNAETLTLTTSSLKIVTAYQAAAPSGATVYDPAAINLCVFA